MGSGGDWSLIRLILYGTNFGINSKISLLTCSHSDVKLEQHRQIQSPFCFLFFIFFFSFTTQLVSFLVWMYKFFQVLYSPLNGHYYWVIIPIVVQVSKLWFPILVIISSIVIRTKRRKIHKTSGADKSRNYFQLLRFRHPNCRGETLE